MLFSFLFFSPCLLLLLPPLVVADGSDQRGNSRLPPHSNPASPQSDWSLSMSWSCTELPDGANHLAAHILLSMSAKWSTSFSLAYPLQDCLLLWERERGIPPACCSTRTSTHPNMPVTHSSSSLLFQCGRVVPCNRCLPGTHCIIVPMFLLPLLLPTAALQRIRPETPTAHCGPLSTLPSNCSNRLSDWPDCAFRTVRLPPTA